MPVPNMTLPQFERNLCQGLKVEKLSKTQRTIASVAHGIYLRQMNQASSEVADLRVEIERSRADLLLEQFRAALGGFLTRESLQRFGAFWVTPIARSREAILQTPELPPMLLEGELYEQEKDPKVGDVSPNTDAVKRAGGTWEPKSDQNSQRAVDEYLKSAPWYLKYPTVIVARVFGDMTPLAAAVLLVSAVAGAIIFGLWSRSFWKGNYEAEQATVQRLTDELAEERGKLVVLSEERQQHNELALKHKDLTRRHAQTSDDLSKAQNDLRLLRIEHQQALTAKEQEFAEELERFRTDSASAFAARDAEQRTKIETLSSQLLTASEELAEEKRRLADSIRNQGLKTDREKELRDQLIEANEKAEELAGQGVQIRNQLTNARILQDRMGRVLTAVDAIFWSRDGALETRRACFRQFYGALFDGSSDMLEAAGLPTDMPSADYDLGRDAYNRLKSCNRYFR